MIQTTQDLLKTTLSASAAFQTMVSAGDATAALARIYHDYFPRPASGGAAHTAAELVALRPCAIVFTADPNGFVYRKDATGGADSCFRSRGSIHIVLFRDIPTAYLSDPSGADTTFRTVVGDIMEDLAELSESAGYLAIQSLTLVSMLRVAEEDVKGIGDSQEAHILVDWGLES